MNYFGYATNNVRQAVESYKQRFGQEPTLVVARPEHQLVNESEIVFRSRFGAAGGLLVTHLSTVDDMKSRENIINSSGYTPNHKYQAGRPGGRIVTRHPGRPAHDGGKCPHCGNEIRDFNALGHWHGWIEGKIPPYWESLREYVFFRDHHTCQICKRRLLPEELRCHHMIAKEIGGTDSARNLITYCGKCHPDEHPIFSDDETGV